MSLFSEGDVDCIKKLLRPAERVLRTGRDIIFEDFSRREQLWYNVRDAYDDYLDGECGEFLRDLDTSFRAKFEAALAMLAWSFNRNNESFYPAKRFTEEELQILDEITRYNVFEILTKDDILKKLYRGDKEILELLKTYYLGIDKWVEKQLENSDIKLPLRYYLKNTWERYKQKLNDAFNEANKYDWFRKLLEEWEKEKIESIDAVRTSYESKIQDLRDQINQLTESFEREKERIRQEISSASEMEIEKLRREKQKLIEQFEKEKEILAKQLTETKDKELQKELEKARERMLEEVKRLEEELQKRSTELKRKEIELKRKETELVEKEKELKMKIDEILRVSDNLEKGSRLIIREDARIQELNFIDRLKSKFKDKVEILGKTYKVEEKSEKVGVYTEKFNLDERTLKNLPENRYLEIRLKEKKLLGGSEVLLKCYYVTRVDKLAEYGFDTDPLELADINMYLVDARDSLMDVRTILLIASPLGFEKKIKNYISSNEFHKNFYSENVSLLLLDIDTGELIYNPNDEFAKALIPSVRMELDKEIYTKIKECIRNKLQTNRYLTLNDVSECGDAIYVKKAFYDLANETGGIVKYIENAGLVLIRR